LTGICPRAGSLGRFAGWKIPSRAHGAPIFLQPSVGYLKDISMMAWNDNLKGVEPKRRFR
jgi:hypothetical protein